MIDKYGLKLSVSLCQVGAANPKSSSLCPFVCIGIPFTYKKKNKNGVPFIEVGNLFFFSFLLKKVQRILW